MKSLRKTLTGLALLGALAFGYKTSDAQIKIAAETSIENTAGVVGVPLQRTIVDLGKIRIKYDKTTAPKGLKDPEDVGAIFYNNAYSSANTSVSAYIINVGNLDGKDEIFPGAWITNKIGNTTAIIEAGKSIRKTGPSREYVLTYLRGENFSGDAAYFAQGSTFGKNDIYKFVWGAFHNDGIYLSVGRNINKNVASLGTSSSKNFGSYTYAIQDGSNNDLQINSECSVGNVDNEYYSTGMFNTLSNYNTLPSFFSQRFNPVSSRGDASLSCDYWNSPTANTSELEMMIGTNQPLMAFGVGFDVEKKGGATTKGLTLQAYKKISLGNFTGDLEFKCNSRTNDLNAYFKAAYEF